MDDLLIIKMAYSSKFTKTIRLEEKSWLIINCLMIKNAWSTIYPEGRVFIGVGGICLFWVAVSVPPNLISD